VVRAALEQAGRKYETVDAIAVTQGPGLAGALLVGLSFAKAVCFAVDKPLIAVNHLEGHIHAVLLEERQKGNHALEFPVLALVVSGGHTHLFLAESKDNSWTYTNVGHTRDDAAGEAFDKVAKLLGLGYPGGPIIDRLSKLGDPRAVKFSTPQIKHRDRRDAQHSEMQGQGERYPGTDLKGRGFSRADRPTNNSGALSPEAVPDLPHFDFSYSGIKTAVLRYVELNSLQNAVEARRRELAKIIKPTVEDYKRLSDRQTLDLVSSFQRTVVDDLVTKTLEAAAEFRVATLLVTGGVAANSELRETFERKGAQAGLKVFFPSRPLSTDNAAMIAAAAYPKFLLKDFAGMDVTAEAGMVLR
jgi:N6-L-threonylcarbamoyladenine synthase